MRRQWCRRADIGDDECVPDSNAWDINKGRCQRRTGTIDALDEVGPLRRYLPARSEARYRAEDRTTDEDLDPRRTAGRSLR